MTLDRRMRQAAESVRRYADAEVDPVAMLWRQRSRQRRRSLQTAAVALALLAGLVAFAVLVARAPRQPEVIAPPPRPLGRVAVDGNTVWVARLHTDVVRLDWAAGKVAGRFTIGPPGSSSYDVIAAGSGVAVTHGNANDADQLGPRTGTATAIRLGGDPAGAAFGAGSFWVSAENSTLARIDPASRRVVATIRLDADHLPGAVVVGDSAVWAFAGGGLLQRIDPVSNQVVHTLAVGPDGVDSGRLAVGAGSVWLSDAEARTLIRIDTRG